MRAVATCSIQFLLIGQLLSQPVHAYDQMFAPAPKLSPGPTQVMALKPMIKQVQPTGCQHRGDSITIEGDNFGNGVGKTATLNGDGVLLDLIVTSWGSSSISATVPNSPGLADGQSYPLGIQKAGHGGWLSNVDMSIVICSATSSALPSSRPLQAGAGGSLLQGQLPPPPQGLPAPSPKEDATMEPGEVVVMSSNMSEAQALATQAQSQGLGIKRRSVLKGLGYVVTVLRVPKGTAAGSALTSLRGTLPNIWADVNHRYALQGAESNQYGRRMIGWNVPTHCAGGIRIGLLDSPVDKNHPALRGRAITEQSFLAAGIQPAPADHGTATAALLVANPLASGLSGLMPDAHLYIATIFRDRGNQEIDTTAEWIVLALDWLASQQVGLVNLSLGGPRNLLVEAAVQRLQERGVAVVAAAGNGGVKGQPVYPAAQPGVVAVTAVDANLHLYKNATHGDYITFSAPGVDIWTAAPDRDGVYLSGTSYATPFVTAAMASARLANPKATWPVLEQQLQRAARDLGAPGKDSVYGWGLIQASGECTVPVKTKAGRAKAP